MITRESEKSNSRKDRSLGSMCKCFDIIHQDKTDVQISTNRNANLALWHSEVQLSGISVLYFARGNFIVLCYCVTTTAL